MSNVQKLWAGRILIWIVTVWNIQCAILFILHPAQYAPGFNLDQTIGPTIIRSIGLLFLMWNIPYLLASIHPYRWRICLETAGVQQSLGLVGETWIRANAPPFPEIQASILRFIYFDKI